MRIGYVLPTLLMSFVRLLLTMLIAVFIGVAILVWAVRLCAPSTTVVQLQVWESQAERVAGAPPIRYDNDLRTFATELELQANNPVDYAYQLLQAGDEFTNATWNV